MSKYLLWLIYFAFRGLFTLPIISSYKYHQTSYTFIIYFSQHANKSSYKCWCLTSSIQLQIGVDNPLLDVFSFLSSSFQRLETDLAYWKDQSQANDQGRQHHYDENAALGPRSATGYRHGANVNYDYY